jgi:hypothetical protein
MLAADVVEAVAGTRKGSNRPAQLYRLERARTPTCFARTFKLPR